MEEKATPRYGAWGLFLMLGPHLGPRHPAVVTKHAGRGGACPPGAGMGMGEASLCEYTAPAAGIEDASVQVSPLEGAQLARRACRLGQEKPAQHTKAVMFPSSFLLKSLLFRQKT